MSQTLCLNRQCLGLVTRIECIIRPLSGGNGLWTLLCAAGIDAGQPTAIKAQGPFHGPREAESVLKAIAENLYGQGYAESESPSIWQLHMQAELRKVNANQARYLSGWGAKS
ncbi:MAG: PA4575 family protein [Pseudomonadales bacterium]